METLRLHLLLADASDDVDRWSESVNRWIELHPRAATAVALILLAIVALLTWGFVYALRRSGRR